MVVTITDPRLDDAVMEQSSASGLTVDDFVASAVREKLAGQYTRNRKQIDWDAVRAIQERVAAMPTLDVRSADELLGYDDDGLPTR
jgi:antitoxin VapB